MRLLITSLLVSVRFTAAAPSAGQNAGKLVRSLAGAAVEDSYIVVIKDGASVDASIQALANAVVPLGDLKEVTDPCRTRLTVINAFTARLSGAALQHVLDDPNVDYVQEDLIHFAEGIDQQVPLGSHEPFNDFAEDEVLYEEDSLVLDPDVVPTKSRYGSGVDIYILDTGVRVGHRAFGGRARWGASYVGTPSIDYDGHGTHVAGTAAGVKYGPATKSTIIAVKVLDDKGSGRTSTTICGIEFATRAARRSRRPSIVNMSLGKKVVDRAEDTAVRNSIQTGLTYVIAAGNDHDDASKHSPARVFEAITVGSINATNYKARSSNYGPAVNVWFRGVDVLSSDHASDTASSLKSGTSMATPGVAGILACVMGYQGKPIAPQVLKRALLRHAKHDVKGLLKGNTTARAVQFWELT